MGQAKKQMMQREEDVASVLADLQEAGAIMECPVHDGIFLDNNDAEAVEEVRVTLVEESSQDEADSLIDEAMSLADDTCPICMSNARD